MTFTSEETKENYFLSQPHQPFFILAIVNAFVMMLIFALNYKGVVELHVNSLYFHSYTLIFTLFANVFTGFLFTTFPRFCQDKVIEKSYYSKIFFANVLGTTLFLGGVFLNEYIMRLGMLTLLLSQAFVVYKLWQIYTLGTAADKKDAFWILIANYFGLLGHLLFIFSFYFFTLESLAIGISFYMYLIFLTFVVAQRMIPFFSHSYEQISPRLVVSVFILFSLHIILQVLEIQFALMFLNLGIGLYLLNEFLSWKFTPLSSPAILWVLHLGLFWLPAAFIISAVGLALEIVLDTSLYSLGIHLIAIGFLTTILIGFGTRVTLGHSSQPPHADKFAIGLFFFIQVVVLLRGLLSVNLAFGWGLDFLFDISLSAWLVLFLLWGGRYAKVLVFGSKI